MLPLQLQLSNIYSSGSSKLKLNS